MVSRVVLEPNGPRGPNGPLGSIGRFVSVSVSDSLLVIALAVDMTARNVQDAVKKKGLPWTTAKGFDTFCPVG